MGKIRKTVYYDRDSLFYSDEDLLIYVKDGYTVGSLSTGLDIMSLCINNLKDFLSIAPKHVKLEIIDSMVSDLKFIRKEIKDEKDNS